VSRRIALPALALAAACTFLSPLSRANAESPRPAAATGCASRSVDNTSPQMQAFLKGLREVHAIGVPTLHQTATSNVQQQDFNVTTAEGTPVKVTVTCAATGCISGCATTGCNPITVDGEPGCSTLVCKNSSGLPCGIQGSCAKTVTQATGSTPGTVGD
jgi:hypothetical protein